MRLMCRIVVWGFVLLYGLALTVALVTLMNERLAVGSLGGVGAEEILRAAQAVDTENGPMIRDAGFPCVGAKSALTKGQMRVLVARDITSAWDDMRIYPALMAFAVALPSRI